MNAIWRASGNVWTFIWSGVALIVVELLSLVILYTLERGQLTLRETPPNRLLPETECPAEAYRTYWQVVAFLKDKGHPPAALGELIPDYAHKIPSDPKTGKPLDYRTDGKHFTVRCPKN